MRGSHQQALTPARRVEDQMQLRMIGAQSAQQRLHGTRTRSANLLQGEDGLTASCCASRVEQLSTLSVAEPRSI